MAVATYSLLGNLIHHSEQFYRVLVSAGTRKGGKMSNVVHMTDIDTVEMLKMTQSHPSEAAVVAGRREPYHLTYIKKYGYVNQNGTAGQDIDGGEK